MVLDVTDVTLLVIIGTLAAIVYSLRLLVLMERRIGRIENHLEKVTVKILREEMKIGKRLSSKKKKR